MDTLPISAIEHWVYCGRQCALIHGDGVWVDNEHTHRGQRFHLRADSGRHRQERGRRVLRSIPLWSESLGLVGRADTVEVDASGAVVPVEYKAGVDHGEAADLQVCAQALCLEEMLGIAIPRAVIWFGATRHRRMLPLDERVRGRTVAVIAEIRVVLESGKLPSAPADARCRQCQLQSLCLPELVAAPQRVLRYLNDVLFACDT